jgi:hypothetical protein
MLTPGYESAEMSTEDTLYPIVFCREQLVEQLAKDVLARMQQGVRLGKIEGHMPYQGALNQNALTFVQVSPDIAYREYGIMIEARTSNEQKMWLLQQMQQDIANGFLDSSDAAILINTHNVKQAMMIWAYKVKKAKEAQAQQQMAQIQENNRGSAEAAQIAIQGDMAKMDKQTQNKIIEIQAQGEEDRKTEMVRAQGKNADSQTQASAKVYGSQIAANAAIQKQILANQKSESTKTE